MCILQCTWNNRELSLHLSNNTVFNVGLLIAPLVAQQCDLKLAEGFRQNITLCKEFPPLHDVGFKQRCVILVTEYSLK